jgi:hypothetical protein
VTDLEALELLLFLIENLDRSHFLKVFFVRLPGGIFAWHVLLHRVVWGRAASRI